MCLEARGDVGYLLQLLSALFGDKFSHRTWAFHIRLNQLASDMLRHSHLSAGSGDPHTASPVCEASALPTSDLLMVFCLYHIKDRDLTCLEF